KLRPHQLQLLYDTLMNGDGHKHKNGGTNIFSQKCVATSEAFQALSAMLGKRTYLRKHRLYYHQEPDFINSVSTYRHDLAAATKIKPKQVWHSGIVWCPT